MLAHPCRDGKENSSSPQKGKFPILVKRILEKRIRFPLRIKPLPAAGEAGPCAAKTPNQKMRNCKSFLAVPSRGRPSAPCARHKRGRAKCHREKRGPDGRAKRRAERREVNDCDEAPCQSPRLAKRGREVGDARNLRFYNPTLPRLWRGPARHARVTARPAERRKAASEAEPRATQAPNQKMCNCKSFLAVPSRGRPSAPRARHKRQTVRRALPTFGTAANRTAQDAF